MKPLIGTALMSMAFAFGGCCATCQSGEESRPHGLTVEYRDNPSGLDTAVPRFGWKQGQGLSRGAKDVSQVAYRILAASSRAALDRNCGDLWDTGRVAGDVSVGVAWGGAPLATSQRVFWKVKTWCNYGRESEWSEPAEFTMGVMRAEDWKARWIGPAACTRPDEDFGAARWITAPANKKGVTELAYAFDYDGPVGTDTPAVEMVHAGVSQHEIDVNGKPFNRWSGHVHDWRFLRFRNMTPWLVKGRNTVTVRVFADVPCDSRWNPIDPIRCHAAKDVRAFIAKITFPGGRKLFTNGSWTSPAGKVTELGAVRDTDFGKKLVLRAENASPAFARKFTVKGPIAGAVLHVTGVGFYEASMDGVKIGKKVLDPSPSAYDRRVLYSTYRLDSLKPGEHELRILVGHGWYDMRSIATWNFDTPPWRDFPRTIAQLEISYADGSRDTVCTDGSWRQVKSPVGYDDLFEGEVTGAWDPSAPDLDGKVINAAEVPAPKGRLVSEAQPGAEIMRTVACKKVHACGNGTYILDFGENVSGWMRMTLRGQPKGAVASFRYEERVNADMTPATESVGDGRHTHRFTNEQKAAHPGAEVRMIDHHFRYPASHRVCPTDAAFQTDRFVSSGAAEEHYEPRFQHSGFRYVVARGLRQAPRAGDAVACVIHTAFPTIGSFACADPTFNKLMEMGEKAYRGNFTDGVPTDCPHREKNGWTGDASIASELAQFLFENTAGYEKWLRDICDAQLPDGNIPGIVPSSGWGYHWGNGPAWDSALSVASWNLWIYRGDRRIVAEIYPVLVRYLAYTATRADGQGLVKHGLGDWVPVNRAHMPTLEYTSSCYYYQAQRIAVEMALMLGDRGEARRLEASAAKTLAGINAKYYKGKGVYDNGLQSAQAFALAYGIVPEAERPAVEKRLAAAVEEAKGHIDVGLLGSKHLFRALSRMGRGDLAWRILTNPAAPSPVEWVKKGGTTLWEDWNDGSSRNHIMFGDFVGWAYQYLAGIRLAEAPNSTSAVTVPADGANAFRSILIAPSYVPELPWVRASVNGPYGEIVSSWKQADGVFTLDVVVPPNTTATVRLPDGSERTMGSGSRTFTCGVAR